MNLRLFSKRQITGSISAKPAAGVQTPPPEIVACLKLARELGQGTWGVCYFVNSNENNEQQSVRVFSDSFSKKELSSIASAVR